MPSQRFRLPAIVAINLLSALVAGCGTRSVRSTLSTTIGARNVAASFDGGGFISQAGDAAVITFSAGKLVVEKDRVLLDDKELAKLPAGAKKVEVDFSNGSLSVKADGASVYPEKPTK